MRYTIQLSDKSNIVKLRKILDLFDIMSPFCYVTDRERDVLAELVNYYFEHKKLGLNDSEIFKIIFSYDYRRKMSDNIKVDDKSISMDDVNNYLSRLRKKKILFKNTIVDKYLKFLTLVNSEKEFTFVFE